MVLLLGAGAAIAMLARRSSTPTTASPYVLQQASPVRGLSAQEVDDLLNGRGAGFARTAELNSYPGPRHVLDMRTHLELTPSQLEATERIFTAMQREAKRLGREIVDRETALSAAFAERRIDADRLRSETAALAALYGQLRATHLAAHLEMTALLTPDQIAKYDQMRGYGAGAARDHRHDGTD